IGHVKQVMADSRGKVRSLLVDVKGRSANLPAANFSGQGDVLISAMSKEQVSNAARGEHGSDGASADRR
ncbi:MAG: hypothetical protein QM605_16230, partial [Sphingobium sp.]